MLRCLTKTWPSSFCVRPSLEIQSDASSLVNNKLHVLNRTMNRLFQACLFVTAAIAAVSADCSPGYIQREGGNCYKLWYLHGEWWIYADKVCTSEGAWLVTIRNEQDSVWVNNFFLDNRRHHCGDLYWIGGNDMTQEGVWRWVQDGSLVGYTNWQPHQPDNGQWGGEHALEVNGSNRKWNDNRISDTYQQCFICEKKPIGSAC
ncbi:perlucin-like protein [Patiria miniata]|uniref:C-type lectin domain-containing protein n=1 Tax=Patiria miniata TaxID=46514 RepID=A0A913Z6Z3_PATMI|nr:perlucin-like protein [Patiria miniata]